MVPRHDNPPPTRHALIALIALIALAPPSAALAQRATDNPVYVDDSPSAHEALVRAADLAGVGNFDEAATVVQRVLDKSARALVPDPAIEGVYISGRTRAHRVLNSNPELRDHYRELMTPGAQALLDAGETELVERTFLLTPAGYEAALRTAQDHFEQGAFWSAWRTLRQLHDHPDLEGDRAQQAAELLAQVAPFLAADPHQSGAYDEVRLTLQAWGRPPATPLEWPDDVTTRDPSQPGPALTPDSLLDRPLASANLGPSLAEDLASRPDDRGDHLTPWPTVVGSTVLVNNGITISAWNRYALSRLWQLTVDAPDVNFNRIGSNTHAREPSIVATDGAVAAAVTGAVQYNGAAAERVLVALDARSGRVLWTRMAADLDGQLADAVLAGRPLVGEGVVALTANLSDPRRRLVGEYLLAFDAATGAARWLQPLGSVGASGPADGQQTAPTLNAGVIYFAQPIGVAGAVEAASGRVLWIRAQPADGSPPPHRPWEIASPVVHDGRLFMLSPDRQRLFELDPATGRRLNFRSVSAFLGARYLLPVDHALAIVTANEVYAIPGADLANEPFRIARVSDQINGRVVTQGARLLIPNKTGGWLVDPVADGFDSATRIELEHSGNLIATPDQVIAVDDHQVHSYLLWEEARRILLELMAQEPDDPSPPITYAELAFRAGHMDPVLDAFDRAISAVEKSPEGPARKAARTRLFNVLREIVDPSEPRLTGASPELLAALTDRLGQVAATPAERVGYLLAAGWQASLTERPADAIAAYQQVLEEPRLRTALYQGRSAGLAPAELEATQRLRSVVLEHGPALYLPFAAKARAALDEAQSAHSPEPFEDIARAFPLSPAAIDAWVTASDLYAQNARPQRAILAARQGVETARGVVDPAEPALGRAVGRLVELLIRQGRFRAARETLARAAELTPSLSLEIEGSLVDLDSLRERLEGLRAKKTSRPTIGANVTDAFTIEQWVASPPIERTPATPTDRAVLRSTAGDVAMALVGGERSIIWQRQQLPAAVLAIDDHAVYLGVNNERKFLGEPVRQVMALDIDTGAPLWTTQAFYGPQLFQEPADQGPRPLIPLRGHVEPDELTVLIDETTLVLLDRIGNAAGFDLETGQTIWSDRVELDNVYDSWLAAGMLAVGGRAANPNSPEPFAVVLIEARTGQTIVNHPEPREVTWLRISPDGDVLVGLAADIIKLDPFRGEVSWRSLDPRAVGSLNGWTFADRLVFRDTANDLYSLDIASGGDLRTIDDAGVLDRGFEWMRLRDLGSGAFGLASAYGVAIIDRHGKLIGRDAPVIASSILPAAFAQDHVVTLERRGSSLANNTHSYRLAIYELPSLRTVGERSIELNVPPDEVSLIDGRILISASPITVVLDAPVVDHPDNNAVAPPPQP